MKHNHILVVGRLHGDDDSSYGVYTDMTKAEARQAFVNQLRRDNDIREADVIAGYECANVYIEFVVMSAAPFEVDI